jgi:hypothetical protein
MSLVPRSIKESGFDHHFTISALYLEKDNNTSFAGIYKKQGKDYFCISGTKNGFVFFPVEITKVEKLIRGEISLLKFILKSRSALQFSQPGILSHFITSITILSKCLLKRYNKIPNAYYIWHAFLMGTHKNLK